MRRWNHNIQYHSLLLAAGPSHCRRALDVGCGEGMLAVRLRRQVPEVTAIDRDEQVIRIARRQDAAGDIDYVLGDFMTYPLPGGGFDFITCVAALHHEDEELALRRLRDLLAPGGTLAILGLARSRYPVDLPREIAAVLLGRLRRATSGEWTSLAPTVSPPPHTYGEIRSLAAPLLPGARFRRHLLWRYSLIWHKPVA